MEFAVVNAPIVFPPRRPISTVHRLDSDEAEGRIVTAQFFRFLVTRGDVCTYVRFSSRRFRNDDDDDGDGDGDGRKFS